MAHKLEGKTALITGGSRGIGRAICLRLAVEGAEIVVHYHRNRKAAEETVRLIGRDVRLLQADLGSAAEIETMFRQLAGLEIDILVNNAGVWKPSPLGSSPVELVNEIVDTNLKGAFWVMQRALPHLKEGARVINVSSVAGRTGIAGGRSLYGATKAALDALTRNWALELAPRKILVNAVAPGYVTTDMTAGHFSDPATLQRAVERHPLGRLATPEDVADVVAFLCSGDARFITGQSINVSGGFVI
jgi:NAD(P)-dependent dehydrogenase (short-subunit alcohol dehydrogenase family)